MTIGLAGLHRKGGRLNGTIGQDRAPALRGGQGQPHPGALRIRPQTGDRGRLGRQRDQIVALAILMPVVVALGGNAGSQTLAVSVRALAERELSGSTTRRAILREGLAALLNGLVFSLAVSAVAYVWFRDLELSIVIALAMLATFIWAGLSGIIIPLTLKRLGADPAVGIEAGQPLTRRPDAQRGVRSPEGEHPVRLGADVAAEFAAEQPGLGAARPTERDAR